MGILLCEQNFRNVWIRNESVRAEIGQILHTDTHPHTHTTAAKLVVRIINCYIETITAESGPFVMLVSGTVNDGDISPLTTNWSFQNQKIEFVDGRYIAGNNSSLLED